jgi:hypothetical protein
MFPFPRRTEARDPSPEVAVLLRSLPRAEPPEGLRARVLAAHARGARPPRGALSLAWEAGRTGVYVGVATAGLAVVSFSGAFPVRTPEEPRSPMTASVEISGPAAKDLADARVRIVDDRFDLSVVGVAGDRGP